MCFFGLTPHFGVSRIIDRSFDFITVRYSPATGYRAGYAYKDTAQLRNGEKKLCAYASLATEPRKSGRLTSKPTESIDVLGILIWRSIATE